MHTSQRKKRDELDGTSCVYYHLSLIKRDWKILGIRTQFKQQTLVNTACGGQTCGYMTIWGAHSQEGVPAERENPWLEAHPNTDSSGQASMCS